MKKIITKLNDYFYQTAFAVLLFISFFIFKDFWVECLNKFWVDPIASKVVDYNWWVTIAICLIIIFYYIIESYYRKIINVKRHILIFAFIIINVLCFVSKEWIYDWRGYLIFFVISLSELTSSIFIKTPKLRKWIIKSIKTIKIINSISTKYKSVTKVIKIKILKHLIAIKYNKYRIKSIKRFLNKKTKETITPELEIEKTKNCKDEYNRKTIYETTYNTLKTCFYEEGSFAVSISGAWGSGKTVFKEQLKKNYEKDYKVSIIEFEAWKCNSPTIIIRNFFTQLRDELKTYLPNISIDFNNYIDLLLDNDSAKPFRIIIKGVNNLFNQNKDPYETIKNQLKKSKHKVVVFIDDVDRLDANEITEVLRLIRNTANFPYIQFIVTCDNDYVCDTLNKEGIKNPKLYLEKFFNLEIPLPKFEVQIICEELKSRISKTISEIWNIKENDERIYDMIYHRHYYKTNYLDFNLLVTRVLKSTRDVITFNNSFKLVAKTYKYDNHQIDINFQDLFFLELLKYKYPKLHSALWDNTFDFLDISKNDDYLILNNKYSKEEDLIIYNRRYKKPNKNQEEKTEGNILDDEDFNKKIKYYINENENTETPIRILNHLFSRRNVNNPIYNTIYFDRYFMYRLNQKVLTLLELKNIIDNNITIKDIDKLFAKKFPLEFEQRTKEFLEQFLIKREGEYKKIYKFIKLILQKSSEPLVKKEITNAVLDYYSQLPKYKDNEHLKATLDLYNYCITDPNDELDYNFYNLLTCILTKLRLETKLNYEYNEDTKNIIEDFLVNTSQKIPVTQCLNQFIQDWGNEDAFKNNCILSVEELKDIQLNYFKKSEDKFSEEGFNLFYACNDGEREENGDTIIRDEALQTMRLAIRNNPNGYIDNFIESMSSFVSDNTVLMPRAFYEQIFGSKEEFEQFLNSCNSNSIEETRVKNFWRLFKNNNYEPLIFESGVNIQNLIDNCFEEQIKQLEELESIKQEIEKTGNISPKSRYLFINNPLYIYLWMKIQDKIKEIENKNI